MEQIPTAEKHFKLNMSSTHDQWIDGYVFDTPANIYKQAIKFAKMHVEQALKSATEKAKAQSWNDQDGLHQEVNDDSILSAYPPELIK